MVLDTLTFSIESVIHNGLPWTEVLTFIGICIGLVALGGITSGLNVSLLTIDKKKLELFSKSKNTTRRHQAELLEPIIKDHHLLLVTLLVSNATAMEALPIFLDELVASWLAIVISVTFVLIFGEILPQALFVNDPMVAGSRFAWLVKIFQFVFYPICKPIAVLLDHCIPYQHSVLFTQNEIEALINSIDDFAHPDQKTFIEGALKLQTMCVKDAMVEWNHVKVFACDMKLNEEGLRAIHASGFSRVPVYQNDPHNIIGLCLVKNLIPVRPNDLLTLQQFSKRKPLIVSTTMNLYDTINLFQENKTHFALVVDPRDILTVKTCWRENKSIPGDVKFVGVITLEDIIEEIIQEDISDEFDHNFEEKEQQQHMENIVSITNDKLLSSSVVQRYSAKQRQLLRMRNRKKYHDEQLQPLITHRTLSSSQIYNTNSVHNINARNDNNNDGDKSDPARSKGALLFKSKSLLTINNDIDDLTPNAADDKKYNDNDYLLITTQLPDKTDNDNGKNVKNKMNNNNDKLITSLLTADDEITDYNHGQIADNDNDTNETLEIFFDKGNNNKNGNKTSEKT